MPRLVVLFFFAAAAAAGCAGPKAAGRSPASAPPGVDARAVWLAASGSLADTQGDLAAAETAYAEGVRADPSSPSLRAAWASTLVRLGRLDDAASALSHPERADDSVAMHLVRAELALARDDLPAAIAAFERIVAVDASDGTVLPLVRLLIRAKKYDRAAEHLKELMRSRREASLWLELAGVQEAAGKRTEARAALEEAGRLSPDRRDVWLQIVRHHAATEDWNAAMAAQKRLLALDPDDSDATKAGALIERRRGDPTAAAKMMEDLLARHGDDREARSWLAELYLEQKRTGDGLRHLEILARDAPDDPQSSWQLALALRDAGTPARALEVAEAALAREGAEGHSLLWTLKGILLTDQKRYPEAHEALSKAVALEPANELAWFQFGVAADKKGDFDEATRHFYRALARNPKHAQAANYLAYGLAERGEKLDEALRLVRIALDVEPDNGAYLDTFGWILFRQGKHADAVRELEHAVRLLKRPGSREDPLVYEHLGDALAKRGAAQKALDAYRAALSLDPTNATLQKKLGQ